MRRDICTLVEKHDDITEEMETKDDIKMDQCLNFLKNNLFEII